MKIKSSIGLRIGLSTIFALLSVIALFSVGSFYVQSRLVEKFIDDEMNLLMSSIEMSINDEAYRATSMAAFVASMPVTKKAVKNNDRKKLISLFSNAWENIKKQYSLKQMQFHKPPATSFLRIHKLKKLGDDLSSFRKTVLKANRERVPVFGIEKGVAGLGIRGVVPIGNDSDLGTVEFGGALSNSFFQRLKKVFDVDITLVTFNKDKNINIFASTRKKQLSSKEDIKSVINGKKILFETKDNGHFVIVRAIPLLDFQNKSIGALEIIKNIDHIAKARNELYLGTIIFVIFAIFIGIITIFITKTTISNHIFKVTEIMKSMANGDLNIEIPSKKRNDEIGDMMKSLISFKDSLLKAKELFKAEKEAQKDKILRGKRLDESINKFDKEVASVLHINTDSVCDASADTSSSNVHMVASATEELSASVKEISFRIDKSADVAKLAVDEANNANSTIEALEISVGEIDTIVALINNIAEQTNLLALNATIEAARAGDAGKGFSVVAGEVKNLAGQTANATKKISSQILTIQEETKNTVHVINDIVKRIEEISVVSSTIASSMEEQDIATQEIAKNTHYLSSDSEKLKDLIKEFLLNVRSL